MNGKTAAILGVTGMTGQHLLSFLLNDPSYNMVRALVRHPYPKADPKLEVKLVDFADAESIQLALDGCDVIFCCIGTTQKKVKGDQELYRRIDYDIPLRAARLAKENGCKSFLLVSAVGANARSRNFYLRLKGELEEALRTQGPVSIHVFRPSLLLGKRTERRLAERFFQRALPFFSGLLTGSQKKYRPIEATDLAKAMLTVSKKGEEGYNVYEYERIMSNVRR